MKKFIIKETRESFSSIHELRQHALFEQIKDYTLIVEDDKQMTEGISKEFLMESLLDKECTGSVKQIVDTLIGHCTELDPWMPIDENTPTDKNLLVYFADGSMEVARNCSGTWLDNDNLDFDYGETAPTHWQELPEDPKE